MHYALSSSLGSMSGLNTDKLALDLQFATDKTLTARLGPTPTFTRASTATFVGSNGLIQSAAINAARFDHDPITLACKGLLIEESRTNLQTNSQTFASWSTTDLTVAASVINDPMGQLARILTEGSAAASSHRVFQDISATSGTTYSASYYVKAGTRTWCGIVGQGAAFPAAAYFNLSTGALGTGSGAGYVNHLIQPLLNGWYRVTLVATAQATGTASLSLRLTTGDNTPIYNGDGVSFLYASMGQTEAGSFPTSYIPTTTASVVRSADLCSINSLSPWYNFTEGTMLAHFSSMSPAATLGNRAFASISNGTSNNVIFLGKNAGNDSFLAYIVRTGSPQSNFQVSGYLPNVVNKTSISFATNNVAFSVNGSLTTDNTAVIPTTLSILRFYDPTGSAGGQPSGHIQLFRYYKKRVSNSRLQTITT